MKAILSLHTRMQTLTNSSLRIERRKKLLSRPKRAEKKAKQWKDENPDIKGNMRDGATLNQLLILANLESYNAVLIHQGKNQKERMELLRQLALQQIRTLESISTDKLPRLR